MLSNDFYTKYLDNHGEGVVSLASLKGWLSQGKKQIKDILGSDCLFLKVLFHLLPCTYLLMLDLMMA